MAFSRSGFKILLYASLGLLLLLVFQIRRTRKSLPVDVTAEQLQQANQFFIDCCKRHKDDCPHLCRYDIAITELEYGFVTRTCRYNQMAKVLNCATAEQNNTACCEQNGVLPACVKYCSPTADKLEALSMWICIAYLDDILKCHLRGAIKTTAGRKKLQDVRKLKNTTGPH